MLCHLLCSSIPPVKVPRKIFFLIKICFYVLYFPHTEWIFCLVASQGKELPNTHARKRVNVWVTVARRLVEFLMRQCTDAKNPQVCRLLTTITVPVMTPARSVNFLPSDLFTSAFFHLGMLSMNRLFTKLCVMKYYKHLFSFFAKGGKKKHPKNIPKVGAWSCVSFCQAAHK